MAAGEKPAIIIFGTNKFRRLGMSKFFLIFSFISVIAFGSISVAAQCDPNTQSPIKCSYYNEGYQDGTNDARDNRNSDYKRYRDKYERKYEDIFRDGYRAGYESVRPSVRWTNSQRNAYNSGYTIGQNDRRGYNQSRTGERSGSGYDQSIGLYFQQGYSDGYADRPRTYDVAITGGGTGYPPTYPPTYPQYPGGPGTANGSASWSGRVDDRGNIMIRGNRIYTENVSGNGIQTTNQNLNGVLPRRPAIVTARRSDGRGDVTVVQQPSRENNFTAAIQIRDSKSGSGNYRVDISWTSTGPVEEAYTAGNVRWRGRVDQTAQITITGSDVQTQDITQTGLSNVDFSINGYLATRPGSVNVNKRKGRGTVTVLQQPSDYNGYVAIIQIFDPSGGADNYEVDISW